MIRLSPSRRAVHLALLGIMAVSLPACNTFQRLSEIGSGPSLAKIEDPQARPGYVPVNMPMPNPEPGVRNPNSLWRSGARAFFKDQRASRVGDLLTVIINFTATAHLGADSNRTVDGTEGMGVTSIAAGLLPFGLGKYLSNVAAGNKGTSAGGNTDLLGTSGTATTTNSGVSKRNDSLLVEVAAEVIQILPNGNFVIHGKQEVKVNNEIRELSVEGVVRPEDIGTNPSSTSTGTTTDNSIMYEKIAEARISYVGRGMVSDVVQSPRYGQELLDIILPW